MAKLPDQWTDEETTTTSGLNIHAAEFVPSLGLAVQNSNHARVPGKPESRKESINLLFCGHVDAGKSTIGGQLLYLTGQMDERTLERYQTEARERSRESWALSYALDTNEEEREKGKTVEVGRAWFETEKKHLIILDAPGHKCFVPNMISGAAQADVAILVISARKGEFETGFERAGQTREHVVLVKAAGVRDLIVLVNKMDDPTVEWNEQRFEEIKEKLTPFLKKWQFKAKEDVIFLPCSGFTGAGLGEHPGESILPWYKGPTLLEYLDHLPSFDRRIDDPFRFPITGRYKEMGVFVMGKIESGSCRVGDRCILMPNRIRVEISSIFWEDLEVDRSTSGENVRLKLKNIDEEEISIGSILCRFQEEACEVGRVFEAQIVLLDVKNLLSVGFSAVLHLHSVAVEVRVARLVCFLDRKTGERKEGNPRFLRQDQLAIVHLELSSPGQFIALETFSRLSRFTLRDEGRTVACGKVLKVLE